MTTGETHTTQPHPNTQLERARGRERQTHTQKVTTYVSLHFRPLLKQIKNSAVAHIVLDCSTDKIYDVLKQSQQIGMMSDYHSYLITSLVK